jgi:hypothetical protein
MSFIQKFSQQITVDPLNSSLANLAVGAYFIGLPVSTLGVAGLQVAFKSDQNATVYVDQSRGLTTGIGTIDVSVAAVTGHSTRFQRDFKVGDQIVIGGSGETRYILAIASDVGMTLTASATTETGVSYTFYPWDTSDPYNFYTAIGNFGITVQAVNAYYRVRVVNIGSTTSTFLRLDSVLCPIVEAVPRALGLDGYLKTANWATHGIFNRDLIISPMGAQKTAEVTKLVGSAISGSTIDTNFWTVTGTGSVNQTVVPGSFELTTNGVNGGTTKIVSNRSARYIAGQSNVFRTQLRCPAVTGSSTRRWGAYSTTDGFFFLHDGTTLSLVCRSNSSDANIIASGSFNGTIGSTYTVDINAHTYEIYWTTKNAYFIVDGYLLHTFTGAVAPLVQTPSLPIGLENNNTAGNSSTNLMYVRSASISRLGPLNTESFYKYIAGAAATVCKRGPGRLLRVIINNPNAAAQTVTIDDAESATTPTIATLTIPAPGSQSKPGPYSVEFGCPFNVGLTVVTDTNNPVTVCFE